VTGRRINILVSGLPAAQGSKDAIPFRKADGSLGVRVKDRETVAEKISNWRTDVITAARQVIAIHRDAGWWPGPLDGPLNAVIMFTVPLVKLPRRVRVDGELREAIHRPYRRPDLDKMLRATFDALTAAGVWLDDAQVVRLTAGKGYPNTSSHTLPEPGARIGLYQMATYRPPPDLAAGKADLPDPILDREAVGALF